MIQIVNSMYCFKNKHNCYYFYANNFNQAVTQLIEKYFLLWGLMSLKYCFTNCVKKTQFQQANCVFVFIVTQIIGFSVYITSYDLTHLSQAAINLVYYNLARRDQIYLIKDDSLSVIRHTKQKIIFSTLSWFDNYLINVCFNPEFFLHFTFH